MTDSVSGSTQENDHLAQRAAAIKEFGALWRQAIAKSGVTDERTTESLLQVCAACYLDGMWQGVTSKE